MWHKLWADILKAGIEKRRPVGKAAVHGAAVDVIEGSRKSPLVFDIFNLEKDVRWGAWGDISCCMA